MNTLEDAFLDSLASRMVVEDVAETKAAQTRRQMPTVAEMIGTPEQILEPAKPETAAAVAKGMAQGFVGLPGDLIALARGVYDLAKSGGDLEAFVKGLESATGMPTTEDVKKFLDEAGLKVGKGDMTAETVGEFASPGGYVKGAKSAIKATKKGVGKVKEVLETPPKGAINQAPRAAQGTVKLAPDLEVEIAPAERTKNFKSWFGDSKIVDEKGKPLVMYHGTNASFDEFGVPPRRAIFVSSDPKFASMYSDVDSGGVTPNVMPLYVKANNPFDYENPKDVKNVVDYIFANNKTQKGEFASEEGLKAEFIDIENKAFTKKTLSDLLLDKKRIENWDYIENPTVQKAIKNLGYDAFYVKENGVKNLGLFDAKQLKSAIGNKGTFDPTSANILRGAAVTPVAPAVMQDEEKK